VDAHVEGVAGGRDVTVVVDIGPSPSRSSTSCRRERHAYDRGRLLDGVREGLADVTARLDVHVVSADTFGTLESIAEELGVRAHTVETGADKAQYVAGLGSDRCVAIGNGANDASMLELAALGIAVLGPEGAAASALAASDIVCASIVDALALLLDERALQATLRP
jgi:soluble P-type ATPase